MTRRLSTWLLLLLATSLLASTAAAAPEAHILRIDPRAGINNGRPTLTTVIEVVQFKRISDVLSPCANVTGAGILSCWSAQLERPGALWDPFPFPEKNAHLLIKVGGEDTLTRFVDKTPWGQAQGQADVGTAWLVAVDASSGMGGRFNDARAIAHEFIEAMGPNDLLDLMFFDDIEIAKDTKWMTFKQRAALGTALNDFRSTIPSHGNSRALFGQIKSMTQTAFGALGNSDSPDVPLHQAMVVLSNGAGRGDAESASPSADVFHQYLDSGRFPPENISLPKTPLPVISIWLPNASSMVENVYRNNEAQFMQSLSNPEIGGFFDIVKDNEGATKGKTIIGLVRARFNAMWVVHWELACINSSVDQSFNLVFENTKPMILPDGTFKDVPLGVDPRQWPLDVDVKKTIEAATQNPLYPGGTFSVYGNFCWGGDKARAEAYFIPAGTRPASATQSGSGSRDPQVAVQAMQQLQAEHMLGSAITTGDGFVTFNVPDDEKVLDGTGDNTVARLVVYDNKAHRASAIDEKSVLSLKATKKPLSWPLMAGIAGLAIVIVLLILVLLRGGGGGSRRRGGGAPPVPIPGYGAAPGPYGPPPPPGGGGYGGVASEAAGAPLAVGGAPPQALFAPGPQPPDAAPLVLSQEPSYAASPPVVQVRCPVCGMNTMATPGQPSVCFSCGQPLPAELAKGGGGVAAPAFPPTGAVNAQPLVPPPNPYGAPPGAAQRSAMSAMLRGTSGQFTVPLGSEVRVGRDPAQCAIYLAEPRVSGVHATLRLEGAQLLVRDETSNNGTFVAGSRIASGAWTPVPAGAPLRFGPIEFAVLIEA